MLSHRNNKTAFFSNSKQRYAYVAVLYGNNEYFLGALMLGFSLSLLESNYDKVLLVTPDVPEEQIVVLSIYFKVIKVPYININNTSFAKDKTVFKDVFTKLNIFNLVEYKKILLLDLDMLVLKNMDHLFELNAPAAKFRLSGLKTGNIPPAEFIKLVTNSITSCDEVSGGINAGLMLLEPNQNEFNEMMNELKNPLPYKVNEPEQDYLSYRYRGKWTHIDCKYNYQFSIPIMVKDHNYQIEDIYNLHYSWYINPWEFLFKNKEKVIFIIKNLGDKYVPNTSYFELWLDYFNILNTIISMLGINTLELVKVTNMRDDVINKYYSECKTTQDNNLLPTHPHSRRLG